MRLRGDALCDGLGACLGECPQGALRVVRREAAAFDEQVVVRSRAAGPSAPDRGPQLPAGDREAGGCPGSRPRTLRALPGAMDPRPGAVRPRLAVVGEAPPPIVPTGGSCLGHWPVQITLVAPGAAHLEGADLLVAADCVPFAYARFHQDFLDGRRVMVGCPKLDDLPAYREKLGEIFRRAHPRSVTVVKMQVPCCNGIAAAAREALVRAGSQAPLEIVTIGVDGGVVGRA